MRYRAFAADLRRIAAELRQPTLHGVDVPLGITEDAAVEAYLASNPGRRVRAGDFLAFFAEVATAPRL